MITTIKVSAEDGQELAANAGNGRVGSILVSETDDVRVWHLRLAPGERVPFHRHQLDYFWTVLGDGRARSRYADGRDIEMTYTAGETRHYRFEKDAYYIHDLENIGDTELVFVTVENKRGSANPPLDL